MTVPMSLSPTAAAAAHPDNPNTELIDRILALAIAALPTSQPGHKHASHLHPLLTVTGPRAKYPEVTKAALVHHCWWVDHDFASARGDLDLIHLLDSMAAVRPVQWSHRAMDEASAQGHVHVLGYWVDKLGAAKECQYTAKAIKGAAEGGHKQVLQWWMAQFAGNSLKVPSGFSPSIYQSVVEHLALGGHCDLIQWWTKEYTQHLPAQPITASVLAHSIAGAYSRPGTTDLATFQTLVSTYSVDLSCPNFVSQFTTGPVRTLLMKAASTHIHTISPALALALINLLEHHHLLAALEPVALFACVRANDLDVLARLYAFFQEPDAVFNTLYEVACMLGATQILDWLDANDTSLPRVPKDVQLDVVTYCFGNAARAGQVAALNWWIERPRWWAVLQSSLTRKSTDLNSAILGAAATNHAQVLEWFRDVMFPKLGFALWPDRLVTTAAQNGAVDVLRWFTRHGKACGIRMQWAAVDAASWHGQVEALEYWRAQGKIAEDRYEGMQPFADEDDEDVVVEEVKNRDAVFAWWIQSGMAAAKPLAVFNGLAFSRFPILLDVYLRKFGKNGPAGHATEFELGELKPVVLSSCKKRGLAYKCMGEYWQHMAVDKPKWKQAAEERGEEEDEFTKMMDASMDAYADLERAMLFGASMFGGLDAFMDDLYAEDDDEEEDGSDEDSY